MRPLPYVDARFSSVDLIQNSLRFLEGVKKNGKFSLSFTREREADARFEDILKTKETESSER